MTAGTGRRAGATKTLPTWLQWALVFVMFAILSTVLLVRYVPANPELSRMDEYVYIDAVDKATRGDLVNQGEMIDDYAMELASCRGVESFGKIGTPCGEEIDPALFPHIGGRTSADIHSPVYYFATAWLGGLIQRVLGVEELLDAARYSNVLWLALGLTGLVWAARVLGASRLSSLGVALLIISTPQVRWSTIYVTPDALNLIWGSLIVGLGVRVVRDQRSPIWLGLAAAAATILKVTNIFGVVAIVLFFGLVALLESETFPTRRAITAGLVTFGSAVAAAAGYQTFRSATSLGDSPAMDRQEAFSLRYAIDQIDAFVQGVVLGPQGIFGSTASPNPDSLANVTSWVVLSGLFAVAFLHNGEPRVSRRLAQAWVVSLLGLGPALYVVMNVLEGTVFGLGPRYGMVLVPGMTSALAISVTRPWVRWTLLAYSIVAYVYILVVIQMR
ncbi:MAG: hypothetical protein EOL89_06210 [Actinobacteria bacterium]|nr:hypothetical protein [Actinomycetota bacterium]